MTTLSEPAGAILRQWRNQRGVSQLHLACEAEVSARHISFVENGRSNPSREMIVQLSEALEIPLRERNRILQAAGFASIYRETPLSAPELEQVDTVIDLILESHLPSPAVAVDWDWNVIKANASMALMAHFVDPALLQIQPLNVFNIMFAPGGLHEWTLNWDEVGPIIVNRIRRDAQQEGREQSGERLEALMASLGVRSDWIHRGVESAPPPLIPMHLRRNDLELRLFTTITTLGTPQDITLQELRIETFHPMDAASRDRLEALAGGDG